MDQRYITIWTPSLHARSELFSYGADKIILIAPIFQKIAPLHHWRAKKNGRTRTNSLGNFKSEQSLRVVVCLNNNWFDCQLGQSFGNATRQHGVAE